MSVWNAAWRDLQDRPHLVYAFMGAVVLINAPAYFLGDALAPYLNGESPAPWVPFYTLGRDLYLVTALAAVQALCFSALGREVDRPLWRCPSLLDGLKRFYMPWLLYQLAWLALFRMQISAARADEDDLAVFMEVLLVVYEMVVPLVVICVMHFGRFEWREVPQAARPLLRFPMLAMQVASIYFFAHIVWMMIAFSLSASGESSSLLMLGLLLPIAFLDIFAFAAMWRVCMHARHAAVHGEEDDPFDF
jgi:hypothetical protein